MFKPHRYWERVISDWKIFHASFMRLETWNEKGDGGRGRECFSFHCLLIRNLHWWRTLKANKVKVRLFRDISDMDWVKAFEVRNLFIKNQIQNLSFSNLSKVSLILSNFKQFESSKLMTLILFLTRILSFSFRNLCHVFSQPQDTSFFKMKCFQKYLLLPW